MVTSDTARATGLMTWLWRTSAVLFTVWGIVHVLAGVMTMSQLLSGRAVDAVHAITPRSDRSLVDIDYPDAVIAILCQHGFNLAWVGVVVTVAAVFMWRRSGSAFWLAAITGGLLDLGYFIFIDLGGFAEPPGPQMTYICAAAIITGGIAATRQTRARGRTGVARPEADASHETDSTPTEHG
ncbi:MAG: hypothetical protein AAGI30_11150 [Planctomycetota bacterium]